MAFIESPRFPERISSGAKGGPVFSTTKVYTRSGKRFTNKNWEWPLHNYTVDHPAMIGTDFDALRDFFYNVGGSDDGFRFKDWSDFKDAGRGIFTLVTGSTYQMYKRYPLGSNVFHRIIQKPVSGTASVFRTRSGTTTDITGSSTIDSTTGKVAVTGHVSGDTYAWTGQFDVPVALQNDDAIWNVIGSNNMLTEWPSIALEGIRV